MERETIMIDGVRYYADRPRSCRGCFFWKNRKTVLDQLRKFKELVAALPGKVINREKKRELDR